MKIYNELMNMARVKQETAKKFVKLFNVQFSVVTGYVGKVIDEDVSLITNGVGNNEFCLIFDGDEDNSALSYKFDMHFEAVSSDEVWVQVLGIDSSTCIFKSRIPVGIKMDNEISKLVDAIKKEINFEI